MTFTLRVNCEMGAVTQPPNCHFSDYLGNKPKCNLQFHPITQGDVDFSSYPLLLHTDWLAHSWSRS